MANEAVSLVTDRRAVVVPTRNVAEGIAAILAFDEGASVENNLEVMQEAISAVSCISITHAVRDSVIGGISIRAGQAMGLVNEKIVTAKDTPEECIEALLSHFAFASSITVFCGESADANAKKRIEKFLADRIVDAEIVMIDGKQTVYEYVIALE